MSVTLSLRVTRDKRKPGTKSPSMKEENILHIIEKLRSQTHGVVGSSEYLDELEKAVDLRSQLEKLRQGFNVLKDLSTDKEKQERFYYTILVEMFLCLELKSPLRSGVLRILKEVDKPFVIKELIAAGLKRRFQAFDTFSSVASVANTLSGCFDNFPLGVEGVRACQMEAYKFIVENLEFCKDLLSLEESPVEKSAVCEFIHGLVRAGLHICSLGQSAACQESADFLHQLTLQLTVCDQLPLDTRTNCGLLTVATRNQDWLQMLKNQIFSWGDDLTSLCLFSGFIGSLSAEELSIKVDEEFEVGEKTALQLIFDNIMDIHKRGECTQPTMTLSIARTLVSLSRVLLSSGSQANYILPRLLDYVWEHLEHVMDSVKHLASALLHNLAKIHSPDVDVHGAILIAIRRLPVWGRARHTALSALIGKVPVSQLIDGPRDIISLYQHLNQELTSSHAVNVVQELMKHHYQEMEDKEEWKELWIKPLFLHLDKNPSVPLQQVLSKAVVLRPDIVQYVVGLPKDTMSLRSTLLCLCKAHKLGRLSALCLDRTDRSKWKGVVDYHLLYAAIQHVDEQTRLSCLSLVVESSKTWETFKWEELELITEYISRNFNFESSALRQQNIALLVKFVNRLHESKQALMRQHLDHHTQQQRLYEHSLCEASVEAICVDSLFPGATYSRRVTALHVLTALRATNPAMATSPVRAPTPFNVTSILGLTSTLLAFLSDSYEDVKSIAMRLLIDTPRQLQVFEVPKYLVPAIGKGLEQAGGVKPPECLSAAYFLATLANVFISYEALTALSNEYSCCAHTLDRLDIEFETVYCCLSIVMDALTQQLSVAQVSLLRAASSSPLYGLLFTAKLLLSQVNLSFRDCSDECWKKLIARLIELSFSCSQAVASVVNNDSPEGHFPMDFDFDPGSCCGGEEEEVEGVTSQMVLLCSWRTVKEVSLLLGFLAEEAPIALKPGDRGLLCSDDLLKIGDHLTTLLAETKHRGAFEQAYVGFCKLVSRLWRLPSGPLQRLPQQWLEDTMQEISSNNENLCATRRSAGIPFMIQALICTLVEVEGVAAIEPWVCRLLDMAESASVPPTTHTHALNIMRALFRNTQLGEAVSIFVERAIIITITAFSAPSWMERNSATLLLSALMTRVFGVPRSKRQDQLSWKNKMTGRIFFQRYPKLFGFFQEQLRKASKLNDKDLHSSPKESGCFLDELMMEATQTKIINLHPSLYPVLLILGRLYPSSLEGTDSNVQLTQFIPDIVACAGSNIYKTRTLAATAMVPLLSFSHLETLINYITKPSVSSNFRHGLLLQVAYFLKQSDAKVDQQIFKDRAENWLVKIVNLCASPLLPSSKYSSVEFHYLEWEAIYQVLIIFAEKYFEFISNEQWKYIINVTKKLLKSNQINKCRPGSCLVLPRITELLLKLSVVTGGDDLESVCCEMLQNDMYEVKNTVYDFISCLNTDKDCSERFCVFFKSLEKQARSKCKCLIFEGSKLLEIFAKTVLDMLFSSKRNSYHSEDKAKILMVLKMWRRVFEKVLAARSVYPDIDHVFFLVTLCKDSHDDVALNAVYCLTEFMCLKGINLQEEDLTAVCELLMEFSSLENSETFTAATYDLLSRQFEALQKSTQPNNRLVVYKRYVELSVAHQWPSAVQRVIETEPDSCVTASLLFGLTLGKVAPQTTDQAQTVGRVFDKGEVNDSYEEYMLSKICGKKLQELCKKDKNLLTKDLTPELRLWLTSYIGLAGNSLAQFVALAELKALQLDRDDPCQFLSPNFQYLWLNSLKLGNLLWIKREIPSTIPKSLLSKQGPAISN